MAEWNWDDVDDIAKETVAFTLYSRARELHAIGMSCNDANLYAGLHQIVDAMWALSAALEKLGFHHTALRAGRLTIEVEDAARSPLEKKDEEQ